MSIKKKKIYKISEVERGIIYRCRLSDAKCMIRFCLGSVIVRIYHSGIYTDMDLMEDQLTDW